MSAISHIFALAAAVACTSPGVRAARADAPNFVVFFVDDWGWGDLGENDAGAKGLTPTFDELARGGLRFTDFHAGASVCGPSRAAILTGRLGLRTGMTSNFGPSSKGGLPLNETTIAEILKRDGYRTGMIGKWHLGSTHSFHPYQRGFDFYVGLPYSSDMGCGAQPTKVMPPLNNESTILCPACQRDGEPSPVCPADTSCGRPNGCFGMDMGVPLFNNQTIVQQPADLDALSDRYQEGARSFISNAATSGQPFFLYYAPAHMHVPQNHGERWANRSSTPFATRDNGGREFAASLLEVDAELRNVIDTVEAVDATHRTLILVTGDNGPWECKCNLTGSVGPFQGLWQKANGGGSTAKCTLWEGGHREPGIAHWPSVIAPGRVSGALTSALDFFPTLASLAGVPLPAGRSFDGLDLSGLIRGEDRDAAFSLRDLHHPSCHEGELLAARLGRYKAVWETGTDWPECGGKVSPRLVLDVPLIFDLAEDPQEAHALDISDPLVAAVLQNLTMLRDAKVRDISTTPSSQVDFSSGDEGRSANCCNPDHVACNCNSASEIV